MENLIKALQILIKYGNPEFPTQCTHDVLYVDIEYSIVSKEDIMELKELGFSPSEEYGGFYSYHYGSC